MIKKLKIVAVSVCLTLFVSGILASPPDALESDIQRIMALSETPGMAIGIVEKGQVTFAKGFGVLEKGRQAAVDTNTLFEIGSLSKAFTAAAIAILVDDGLVNWDDRVIEHLPDFQLYDPWVTREVTIVDLLSHRSGLGAYSGDMSFIPRSDLTPEEITYSLRWLKPQKGFRSGYAYNNAAYIVVGELIRRVTGQRWEDFVADRILAPAKMDTTLSDRDKRFDVANRAQGHARNGPPVRGMGPMVPLDEAASLGTNISSAGGVMSNVVDLTRWMSIHLNRGTLSSGSHGSSRQLWSKEASRTMWSLYTPITVSAVDDNFQELHPQFLGYGLAWNLRDLNGHRVVSHGGGTFGYTCFVVLIPGMDVGFIMLQNSEELLPYYAIRNLLLAHYTGVESEDLIDRFEAMLEEREKNVLSELKRRLSPDPGVAPSIDVADLIGHYRDIWYRNVIVSTTGRGPKLVFPRSSGMSAVLEHHSRDTYIARWENPSLEPAFVSFLSNASGGVDHVEFRAVSPLADSSYNYNDLELRPVVQESMSPDS